VALGIALVAGLLLGLQREQANAERTNDDKRIALGGVRTFPLIALGGGVAAVVSGPGAAWLPSAGLLGLIVLLASHRARNAVGGMTSEVAAVVTWLLGALAGTSTLFADDREKAVTVVSTAVVAALLLSVKIPLHSFVRKLNTDDILATLQLLLVAVVVVPLLPDRTLGPYDVINPAQIGRMVLLIAGISFVGYAASRYYGAGKGMAVTGLVGGLASSTAVTVAMARHARADPTLVGSAALSIVLACGVLLVRIVVVVALVYPPLLADLMFPIGAMMVAALVAVIVLSRRRKRQQKPSEVALKNPMELKSAVVFAVLFAVVMLASKVASTQFGPSALFLTALVAGGVDVDTITLSAANLARSGTSAMVATAMMLMAVASNTIVKACIAFAIGGRAIGLTVSLVFAVMVAAGAAGVALRFVSTG
jgi:uncharacterized membrane protein (DUF4010 family)